MRDWVYGAPDLIVEILSPSTASRDRQHKLNLYAQHGVAEYWIVDPGPRHIDFCVLQDGEIAIDTPEAGTWRSPAAPGLELDVDELWTAVEREFGPPAGP